MSNSLKVDEQIRPLHFKDRKPVELTIGNSYYVSFSGNIAEKCTLLEIDQRNGITVTIEKDTAYGLKHHLFRDEIGLTPEEAVLNQVTPS
jgi:hypothetical protein